MTSLGHQLSPRVFLRGSATWRFTDYSETEPGDGVINDKIDLDLILGGFHGRLVVLKNGRYDDVPLDVVTSSKKIVNVEKYYNTERLRPHYHRFEMKPLFLMAADS